MTFQWILPKIIFSVSSLEVICACYSIYCAKIIVWFARNHQNNLYTKNRKCAQLKNNLEQSSNYFTELDTNCENGIVLAYVISICYDEQNKGSQVFKCGPHHYSGLMSTLLSTRKEGEEMHSASRN